MLPVSKDMAMAAAVRDLVTSAVLKVSRRLRWEEKGQKPITYEIKNVSTRAGSRNLTKELICVYLLWKTQSQGPCSTLEQYKYI